MTSSSDTRSSATKQIDVSAIREFGEVLLTSPARLCFIVEERYENDVMPGAVVDVLRSCGHHVDVLRPNGTVTDLWELLPTDAARYDAFVLKTVSDGPGLSLLDAAAAADVTTVNDYRAIRLARDKAVAAVRARAAGIPFPKTWFASQVDAARPDPGRQRIPWWSNPTTAARSGTSTGWTAPTSSRSSTSTTAAACWPSPTCPTPATTSSSTTPATRCSPP